MASPGLVVLHAYQTWATRNPGHADDQVDSWKQAVRFHGSQIAAVRFYASLMRSWRSKLFEEGDPPTIVHVNLFRGFLWPTAQHLRDHAQAQSLFAHLCRDTTTCKALVLARGELVGFLTPSRTHLAAAMATGVWRLLVANCYESIFLLGMLREGRTKGEAHEDAVLALASPVTTVLSFLCPESMSSVCWQVDWPAHRF